MSVQLLPSEIVLVATSVLVVGVKVPVQVMLSLLAIDVSDPLGFVMSSSLEKEATGSGKTTLSSAVWPYKSNDLERVKMGTPLVEGSISSTI